MVLKKEVNGGSRNIIKVGKLEKRFEKFVRKVITVNKVIKVFEENKCEMRRVDMADGFKITLPVFDGND